MWSKIDLNKQNLTAIVFFLYLFPILLLSIYGLGQMPQSSTWNLFSMGLLVGIVGSILLFWMMNSWSSTLKVNVEPVLISSENKTIETPNEHSELFEKMSTQSTDLQRISLENEQAQRKVVSALLELESYKKKSTDEIQQRERRIQDCQDMLMEQSALINTQKVQITKLEEREKELAFEVKTLLKLTKEG